MPGQSGTLPGDGQVLAREAKSYQVALRQVMPAGGADVVQGDRIRPLALEQFSAIRVLFDVRHDFEPFSLEAEVDPADAGEQADKTPAHLRGSDGGRLRGVPA